MRPDSNRRKVTRGVNSPQRPGRAILFAALVVVVLGIVIRFANAPDEPTEAQPAVISAPSVQTQAAIEREEQISPRHEPSLPFELRPARLPKTSDESQANPEEESPYEGEWNAYIEMDGTEIFFARATFTLREGNGIVLGGDFAEDALFSELTLVGSKVTAESDLSGRPLEYSGAFNAAVTELYGTIRGDENGEQMQATLRFVKMTQDELARETRIDGYTREVEEMLSAIYAYSNDHDGAIPENLEALIPDYLPNRFAIENVADRHVAFDSDALMAERLGIQGLPPLNSTMPEDLIEYEAQLQQAWGDTLYNPRPLITVTYERGEITMIRDRYGVREEGARQPGTAEHSGNPEARNPAIRASCANNLKQLGLISKMFSNEQGDDRFPAGPHHLYPEYMPDPRVLACPNAPSGTISYRWVFPAANEAELVEVYSQVTGEPPNWTLADSLVPLMIETHLCAGDEGSNVLFEDGHVEFMTPEEFALRVEPYLSARIH